MKTKPWMHDGSVNNMEEVIEKYNESKGNHDSLLRPLGLSKKERKDLLNFLECISEKPLPFQKPLIPD
jgi:cytochrome c peroxidase